MRVAILPTFAALCFFGCPKDVSSPAAPSAGSGSAQSAARVIAAELQPLLKAQDEAIWKAWTGTGAPDAGVVAPPPVKPALYAPPAIAQVEEARAAATDPLEKRALTHLKVFLVGEQLARAVEEQDQAVSALEASATFELEGREVPYREVTRLLVQERSAERRKAIHAAATRPVERLNQSLQRKEQRLEAALVALGYPQGEASYAYAAELREVELPRLGAIADAMLQATEGAYKQVLAEVAQRELGLSVAQLRPADLLRAFRGRGPELAGTPEEVKRRAVETLKGLGLAPEGLKNLTLDLEPRPLKSPRPLTVAVAVPDDVRLSVKLAGGLDGQTELLHELGHGLHYALSTERRFELTRLGNGAVTEAYAILLEGLTEDPVWLAQLAGLGEPAVQSRRHAAGAHRLYALRRAAGRVLYGLSRHTQPGTDPRELYGEVMSRALGVAHGADDTARFRVDGEDFLRSADELRAYALAAQLRGQLHIRFGPAWWTKPEAGAWLKTLFASGHARTVEEIALAAGEPALSPEALLLGLGSALNVPVSTPKP
jgi:hypothetical protein